MQINPGQYGIYCDVKIDNTIDFRDRLRGPDDPCLSLELKQEDLPYTDEKRFVAFVENENSLMLTKVLLKIDKEDFYGTEVPNIELSTGDTIIGYDKTTKKCSGYLPNFAEILNMNQIQIFIMSVLKEENKYLYTAVNSFQFGFSKPKFNNFLKIFLDNNISKLEECVKNMGIAFLNTSMNSGNFEVKSSKKLTSSLELPKDVLAFVKNKTELYTSFKKICDIDANEGIYLVKWCKIWNNKNIRQNSKDNSYDLKRFVDILADVRTRVNSIKLVNLIPYLVKQQIIYKTTRYSYTDYPLEIPDEVARTYNDYINMTQGTKELYPSMLFEAHNIAIKNQKVLVDSDICEKFKDVVATFKDYTFSSKDFVIMSPNKPEDLVDEGEALHHCVASYIPMISAKITKVFLLRKNSNPKESFATIELDKDNNIAQIKGKFNQDIEDTDVYDFLDSWTKFLKKKGLI
jgi:hypothetical protein